MKTYNYSSLYEFTYKIFKSLKHSDEYAQIATKNLLLADLRGIDSHGIARLSGYVRLWKNNRVNSNPSISILHETMSTACIDADCALGLIAAQKAMELAISKAKIAGSGWISVQNSNHFGIAGTYAMMALEEDMIGFAFTNASPLVAPTFSKDRLLGTNPIAIAIPAGDENAFVADFATTTAANGKLEILQRKNQDAPLGWIQNPDGSPTSNTNALKSGGSLLPLGSDPEHASHKGFCLGASVDILSGVLSGAGFGPWVPPFVSFLPMPENAPGKGIGHFFGALRIDGFQPANDFKAKMDLWIRTFKNANPISEAQKVIIPGEPEMESFKKRMVDGIPLNELVINDLENLGAEYEQLFPAPLN